MQVPLELTFKNVEKTPELENLIREKVGKLEQVCDHINSCRVAVEKNQEHQLRGNPFRVRVDVTVPPGHEVVAREESTQGDMHYPLDSVIRKTFEAARRQLKKISEKQHGDVKVHPQQQMMAFVTKLFPEDNYGFIRTIEGADDVYFHRNSVVGDDWDRMEVGNGVRFVAKEGEKGLQATTVEIVET